MLESFLQIRVETDLGIQKVLEQCAEIIDALIVKSIEFGKSNVEQQITPAGNHFDRFAIAYLSGLAKAFGRFVV